LLDSVKLLPLTNAVLSRGAKIVPVVEATVRTLEDSLWGFLHSSRNARLLAEASARVGEELDVLRRAGLPVVILRVAWTLSRMSIWLMWQAVRGTLRAMMAAVKVVVFPFSALKVVRQELTVLQGFSRRLLALPKDRLFQPVEAMKVLGTPVSLEVQRRLRGLV